MNNLFLYLVKKHDESTDSSSDYLDYLDLPQEKEKTGKDSFILHPVKRRAILRESVKGGDR